MHSDPLEAALQDLAALHFLYPCRICPAGQTFRGAMPWILAFAKTCLLLPLLQSPLFRVGSGALVQRPSGPSTTSSFPPLAELGLPHPGGPYKPYPYKPLPLAEDNSLKPKGHDYATKHIYLIVTVVPFLTIAFLWYMMPGPSAGQSQLAGSSFNFRLPPQ